MDKKKLIRIAREKLYGPDSFPRNKTKSLRERMTKEKAREFLVNSYCHVLYPYSYSLASIVPKHVMDAAILLKGLAGEITLEIETGQDWN
jgi:hypothetical protein